MLYPICGLSAGVQKNENHSFKCKYDKIKLRTFTSKKQMTFENDMSVNMQQFEYNSS